MHLDDEQVQRWLHGELALEPGAQVREHLVRCAECRLLVDEAKLEEAQIFDWLGAADHPPPKVSAEAIRALAGGGRHGWGRWAAGVLLGLIGVGAAYAAPGSPIPALLDRVVEWVGRGPKASVTATPESPPPHAGAVSGIVLAPGNRLTIMFAREQAAGLATVRFTESGDVVVRAPQGSARFTSDVSRLSIDNEGDSTRFDILIPRDAPWVEIRLRGRQVFLSQGSRVATAVEPDADGRYSLPLAAPRP